MEQGDEANVVEVDGGKRVEDNEETPLARFPHLL